MKKIYLLLIVILMFFVSGCQTQSAKEKVGISIDNVTMSSEKEELIINISIQNEQLITEKNYIKEFNYYYSFEETTKEQLIKQNKNVINNKELIHHISFTETNYKNDISIIFEIKLAKKGNIYSEVKTINIFDFAKETYEQDQTNLIARHICYPGEVLINFDSIQLSNEKEEIKYIISLYNSNLITEVNYIKQFNYYYAFEELNKEELLKQNKNEIINEQLTHNISFDELQYKSNLSIIFEIELALDGYIYSNIKTINIYEFAKQEYLKDNTNLIAKKICDEGNVIINCSNINLSNEKEEILYNLELAFEHWITDANYIKQFNYYYAFTDSTKEELISLNKNVINNKELTHKIPFTEANYKNDLSIIFEMELANDGFIYSEVYKINISNFARSEYLKDESNRIARKICGLKDLELNISNVNLSSEEEKLIYQINILNDTIITEKNYIKQFNYYYAFNNCDFEELLKQTKNVINNKELIHEILFTEIDYKNDLSIIFEIELALDGFIYSKVNNINIYELAKEEYLKDNTNLIAKKICDEGNVIINCTNVSLSDEKEEITFDIKIGFDHWITEANYIKQFNYYYAFNKTTKEELLKQTKNIINGNELSHTISFNENNYNDILSIIFEMELANDGYIYSMVKTINIKEFAFEQYQKNEANRIAIKICGLKDLQIDISNVKLSTKKEEIIYEISLLNDSIVTENNYIKQFNYYYAFNSYTKEDLLNKKKVQILNNTFSNGIIFKEANYLDDLSIIFEIELAIDGYIYSEVKTINITDFAKSEYQRNEANLIARKICGLGEVKININDVVLSKEKEELIYTTLILGNILITEKNYIKQFNYYYSFQGSSKEELLMQNKNIVLNNNSIHNVAFSRAYYESNISIIFELELAIDGYIYSEIKTINILEMARNTYLKDQTNLIAKTICEYNRDQVILIDLKLDLNKKQLSGETQTYSYTYSNPSYNKITVIITLKEGYTFSDYFILRLNDEFVDKNKYKIEGNVITYIFDDPNWSIIV